MRFREKVRALVRQLDLKGGGGYVARELDAVKKDLAGPDVDREGLIDDVLTLVREMEPYEPGSVDDERYHPKEDFPVEQLAEAIWQLRRNSGEQGE